MQIAGFRQRLLSRVPLAGTFLKTPAYQMIEVLSQSELDFVCLDAEHAPFDRGAIDACCAMGRALDFPVLVRVGDSSAREILQALDCGAVGIVVPHVDSAAKAADVARSARFGRGGRGYAGSTRWAGFASQSMPDLLKKSQEETVVMVQIEELDGVADCEAIAATNGIDAVFLGLRICPSGMVTTIRLRKTFRCNRTSGKRGRVVRQSLCVLGRQCAKGAGMVGPME